MHNIGYGTRWGGCSTKGESYPGRPDGLDIGMAGEKEIKWLDIVYKKYLANFAIPRN